MAGEKMKNLCAPIPEPLHLKVREHQERAGQTLGQYMTWLIAKFYEGEERSKMKEGQKTVAFQVPEELFRQFKDYLKRQGVKQNAFFLACIRRRWRRRSGERARDGGKSRRERTGYGSPVRSRPSVRSAPGSPPAPDPTGPDTRRTSGVRP